MKCGVGGVWTGLVAYGDSGVSYGFLLGLILGGKKFSASVELRPFVPLAHSVLYTQQINFDTYRYSLSNSSFDNRFYCAIKKNIDSARFSGYTLSFSCSIPHLNVTWHFQKTLSPVAPTYLTK